MSEEINLGRLLQVQSFHVTFCLHSGYIWGEKWCGYDASSKKEHGALQLAVKMYQ